MKQEHSIGLGSVARVLCVLAMLCGCATTEPRFETVRLWRPVSGPEDLALVDGAGGPMLMTGSACRRLLFSGSDRKGKLVGLAIAETNGSPRTLFQEGMNADGGTGVFQPLGLSFVPERPAGEGNLFVLNTARSNPSVEVFAVSGWVARRLRSIPLTRDEGGKVYSPNGIVAARDGKVYVSHFKPFRVWKRGTPEAASDADFRRSLSGACPLNAVAVWCPDATRPDGGCWRVAADDFNGANGLALSRDERVLFVADYHRSRVWGFERNPGTGRLLNRCAEVVIPNGHHPDNLTLDAEEGMVYATCQRSALATGLHLLTGLTPAAGVVYRFPENVKNQPCRAELLGSVPGSFAAPSKIVRHGDRYFFGQIVQDGILEAMLRH